MPSHLLAGVRYATASGSEAMQQYIYVWVSGAGMFAVAGLYRLASGFSPHVFPCCLSCNNLSFYPRCVCSTVYTGGSLQIHRNGSTQLRAGCADRHFAQIPAQHTSRKLTITCKLQPAWTAIPTSTINKLWTTANHVTEQQSHALPGYAKSHTDCALPEALLQRNVMVRPCLKDVH